MKKCKKTYIYALLDPRDNLVWYIGKTISPKNRELAHRKSLKKKATKNMKIWLQDLSDNNLEFIFKVFDEASTEEEWQAKERFHIKYFKTLNPNLVNFQEGGYGRKMQKPCIPIYVKQVFSENPVVKKFESLEDAADYLKLKEEDIRSKLFHGSPIKGYLFTYDENNFPKWPMNMLDLQVYFNIC